jgi:hypothetical protein
LDTFVRETDALVDLYVDGEVISTTGEHPFWVPDKGWVEPKDLIVGSLLQTEDGRVVDVDKIEKRFGQFEVYNFRVEGIPTYFVSELGVLVYNTCGDVVGPGRLTPQEAEQIQRIGDNYHTEIHLVGSRAGGRGRNIDTDLPVGKGEGRRSNIDMRIQGQDDIDSRGRLSDQLINVGGGAGSVSPFRGFGGNPGTHPPKIIFKPNQPPIVDEG